MSRGLELLELGGSNGGRIRAHVCLILFRRNSVGTSLAQFHMHDMFVGGKTGKHVMGDSNRCGDGEICLGSVTERVCDIYADSNHV